MRSYYFIFFLLGFVGAQGQQVIALSVDKLPQLTVFRPAKDHSKGTAVIICLGGAYAFRSDVGEGIRPAKLLNDSGITAFVLDYQLPAGNDTLPLHDAKEAIKYVRAHYQEYQLDAHKIGIMGFSAAGHLASALGTHFTNSFERPDFMVLIYPVISMADSLTYRWSRSNLLGKDTTAGEIKLFSNEWQVTDSTPGAFVVHAMDDAGVKVDNSLYFLAALEQHKVPAKLFLYAKGGHAFGIANPTSSVQWTGVCIDWIKKEGWKGKGWTQSDITLAVSDTSGPVVSRNIYGQFAEHLGRCVYDGLFRDGKIRMDVVEALRKIKVPLLRWPGGCFADNYHWRDGLGPLKDRAKTLNIMWGMVPEDNSFGTDEFLQLCHLIGCEPYLAGNMGTGSPAELESWIEYCNYKGTSDRGALRAINGHPEPYRVKYWGIGNESWGCGGRMTPETYTAKYKTFANYCRDYPGSPQITRIASGAQNDDYSWTEFLMSHISSRWMQAIGVHYYTDASGRSQEDAMAFKEDEYFSSLKNALRMEEIINGHTAIMDRFDPAKRIALAIDEWGIVIGDENSPSYFYQQNSLRDALAAATTLNIFNNHADRVRMANLAQIANVLQSLVLTSGDSLLLTPTYWVFDLYKVHQDAHSLVVKFNSPDYVFNGAKIPAINVSASRDSLGAVHISLVNLDPSKAITVRMPLEQLPSLSVTGQILTSKRFNDVNTFSLPDMVKPSVFSNIKKDGNDLVITIPPKSIVVLELK